MDPTVSACCITFNHERFIRKALDGFLMQITDFPFEVIVHDDASTDRTADIIREYEQQYPRVIRPIYQTENQYSKGTTISAKYVWPLARGKYIALCEGDDYWTDPLKLQKQVNFLESHPESPMCFHDALSLWEGKLRPPEYFCPNDLPEMVTIADVITRPWFVPTASILARSCVLKAIPEWSRHVWCGDLLMHLWCAHHGDLGYISDVMSVYRRHLGGLTMTIAQDADRVFPAEIFVYREFDRETDYRYTGLLKRAIRRAENDRRFTKSRIKWGVLSFLLHPEQALTRSKRFVVLVSLMYKATRRYTR